jgi:predicted acyltransferase/4-amino-4-deoxy-L-arabinose transferase-like glycosyltransferase
LLQKLREVKWFPVILVAALIILTLGSRLCVVHFLATDEPGDGKIYTQLAANLLEHDVFSLKTEAPFDPTLIRLPGYPLFVAAVYSIFGHGNDTAVRNVHAVIDTATCVIAAMLAWLWTEDDERKRRNALWTYALMTLCPFIVIYAATLLTETLTTFLMTSMAFTATLGLKSPTARKSALWWIATGILAGAAVMLRPDSGLFAAGIGLTLVISSLFFKLEDAPRFRRRLFEVGWKGAVFSFAFMLVLAPWTIRNYRVFGVFQPLAPAHAEMPGEFVPHNYQRWLRTWIDDSHYIEPMLWNLDEKRINVKKLPAAFDNEEERERVTALLQQYNHPPGAEEETKKNDDDDSEDSDDSADSDDDKSEDSSDKSADSEDKSDDGADSQDDSDDSDEDDEDDDKPHVVKMTPEIDAQFAAIAQERIDRSPARYYLFLPAKRAAALWFDSHSLYYPFGGQMSPVKDLDYDENQQIWLPVFTAVMWIYTLLAAGGALFWWRNRESKSLRWLILLALMALPRIAFFSTIENPEPRYVVELFVFAAILGGFWLGQIRFRKKESEMVEEIIENSPASERMISLDVFRGITIAAMVLVNDPGTWDAIYAPLEHAKWNGITPTDFIFPFFLFIVGVSIAFALGRRVETGKTGRDIYLKIFKRACVIFALGILLEIFPLYNIWKAEWFDPSNVRIMGVLQRIAVCYLISALIFLHTNWKRQAVIAVVLLLVYWALMTLVNVPGCEVTSISDKVCNLAAYLDRTILTENHLWNQGKVYDPEGLLSTIPAIATTLAGVLTGNWLRSKKDDYEKAAGIFFAGALLTVAGWIWSFWFPFNKALWTSSYVVYTAGLALFFLGFCYWLIDLKGYKAWSKPFVIFGSNAIALYVGASIMSAILDIFELSAPHGKTISLQEKIFNCVFLPLAAPINASLLYAVSFVLIWLFLMWLLYRKRIFIKV